MIYYAIYKTEWCPRLNSKSYLFLHSLIFMETKSTTQQIADFVTTLQYDSLSSDLLLMVKRSILDGLAVIMAGSTTQTSRLIRNYLEDTKVDGKSRVLGSSISTSAQLAALANGISGHVMDYDDTQLSSLPNRVYGLLTHPTVPPLAGVLALSQEIECTIDQILIAYCIGLEVECKIAEAINPNHYKRGFHSTGTIGIFGVTVVAAKLFGLSNIQIRYALGIAASKSAGLRVNFGTMMKPYHAGAAAENGIVAAKLARLGYKADPNALDGEWGFFQVSGGGVDADLIRDKLGNPWSILEPGISVKPYPCGSLAHPSMDAILDLVVEFNITPDQIEEVKLGTNSNVLAALRYNEPKDELEAKFSIPFCLGILILDRKAGIEQFTLERVKSPDVLDMMPKIKAYLDESIEAMGFERIRSVVEIKLKSGKTFHKEAFTSRGTPERPMSVDELNRKFRECTSGILTSNNIEKSINTVWNIEKEKNLERLISMLTL